MQLSVPGKLHTGRQRDTHAVLRDVDVGGSELLYPSRAHERERNKEHATALKVTHSSNIGVHTSHKRRKRALIVTAGQTRAHIHTYTDIHMRAYTSTNVARMAEARHHRAFG